MKNIKIIIFAVAALLLVGGGYFAIITIQEQEKAAQVAEAKVREEKAALEQKQAVEAALAARTKCTEVGDYFVITLDHENLVGQDILVKNKVENKVCKYEVIEGDFEAKSSDPEYFKAIEVNSLVTDLGTGPSGRSFRLYDLTDKKLVTEKQYFGDVNIANSTLTYFGLAKQKADKKNCKEYEQFVKDGLTPNLVVEKKVDLKTLLVKEGKTTKCVASQ